MTTIATSRMHGARTGSRHARAALLTSTALLAAAALPSIAAAQDRLPRMESIAYGSTLNPVDVVSEPNIVISAPGTPTTAQVSNKPYQT